MFTNWGEVGIKDDLVGKMGDWGVDGYFGLSRYAGPRLEIAATRRSKTGYRLTLPSVKAFHNTWHLFVHFI